MVPILGEQYSPRICRADSAPTHCHPHGHQLCCVCREPVLFHLRVRVYHALTPCGSGRANQTVQYTMRYIDDLLSGANPVFGQYLYDNPPNPAGVRGIYPRFLTVTQEQTSLESVSFLDTRFTFAQNHWFTDIYDKREHPPLSNVNSLKYPHPTSFLSVRSKFGIITSRLCCFSRICQRKRDFIMRSRFY